MAQTNETAEFVRQLAESVHTYRSEMEGENYVNASYYAGKHHIYWDSQSRQIVEPPLRSASDVRLSINLTTTVVQRLIARMIRDRKEWVPAPATSEEGQLLAARAWRMLFAHYWEWYHLPRLLREEALPSMLLYGRGWLSCKWDPTAGRQMGLRVPTIVRPGEPTGDAMGKEAPEADPELEQVQRIFAMPEMPEEEEKGENEANEEVREGDFVFGSPSYYSILTDPFAFRHEHLRWLIEEQLVPLQEVEELYGKTLTPDEYSDSPERDGIAAGVGAMVGSVFSALTGIGGKCGGKSKYVKKTGLYADSDKLVVLRTLYTAPSAQSPDGRMVVTVGDVLLEAKDNPYGLIPFVPIPCIPVPGSPVTVPMVSLFRPLQLAIDRLVSQDIRNARMFGNPQWLAKRRTVINPEDFDDTEGRLIQYDSDPQDPSSSPRRLDPAFSQGSTNQIMMLREMMYEVAGLNEASRGENPSGGRSAEMLYALSAKDDEGNLPIQQGMDDALSDLGRIILQVGKRFFKEDRVARVVGPGGEVMVREIAKTDILNGFDVKVRGDSYLPRSWSQRVDVAMKMAQSGLYDMQNPEEREELRRMMEFGSINSIWDKGEEQERYSIHEENLALAGGLESVPVNAHDLHKQHLYGHRKFQRSGEYKQLLKGMTDAERAAVAARFDAHTDEHYDVLRVGEGLDPIGVGPEAPQGAPNMTGAPPESVLSAGGGMPELPAGIEMPALPGAGTSGLPAGL